MTQDELKQSVARAAVEHVPAGGVIGVGTGSTANFFIAELAREVIESRSRADTFGPDAAHRSTDARGDS